MKDEYLPKSVEEAIGDPGDLFSLEPIKEYTKDVVEKIQCEFYSRLYSKADGDSKISVHDLKNFEKYLDEVISLFTKD